MKKKRKGGGIWTAVLVILVLVGIPAGILFYQCIRTGMTPGQVLDRMFSRASGGQSGLEAFAGAGAAAGERIDFLKSRPIGQAFSKPPQISHLIAVDLDEDGKLDVVVCDTRANAVTWIRQGADGRFEERVLAQGMIAPAHVEAVDFDSDGDLDLVVAVLGMLFPNNDRIGSVLILENDGQQAFSTHVVAERIARVSDVRSGDLDGDGDLDLVAAQFGYDDGETRWIENLGGWKFESHMLQTLSGPVNCGIADMDADGDLDIALLVSQEWEEIYIFENDGHGRFTPRQIYGSSNDDFGSSGLELSDLDKDGDMDILYTNGDAFDYIPPRPRPWHGVQWLENKGGLAFAVHRLTDFGGAFSPRAADLDADGDLDLVVSSAFNLWENPDAQSLIWLQNDGQMNFTRRDITNTPTHILVVAPGDFDGDGRVDLVTGGMHVYPPEDRMGRVVLWASAWGEAAGR